MFNPFFDCPDPEPILRDVFNGWESGNGIFKALTDLNVPLPWSEDDNVDIESLDIEYFANHSGGKFCAPVVKYLLDDEGHVSPPNRLVLARIILTKYLRNWQRLWVVNSASYNPVHNYDMVETRTKRGANSEAKVGKTDRHDESTDELEHGLVETVEHGRTSDSMSYKYGINTDTNDPKPSEKEYTEDGGTTVTSDTGTDTTTRDLSSVTDSTENTVGATEEEEELHRSGNIGVTTTQKMIEEERRLWVWNYFEQVFSDLDKELALSFHDPCRV